jgi:general secretion pathway protein L
MAKRTPMRYAADVVSTAPFLLAGGGPREKGTMSGLRSVVAWLSRWIEDVAVALTRIAGLFRRSRKVRLVEQDDGGLVMTRGGASARPLGEPLHIEDGQIVGPISQKVRTLLAGSQIDLVLKSSRFIFRPLELPGRASEFLDGVVRAQIDRLTPWSPGEAVFGWSAPRPVGADRIVVTVAASARARIAPIVQALTRERADSVLVSTLGDDASQSAPIQVFAQRAGAQERVRRLRGKLVVLLALTGVAFAASAGASIVVGDDLEAQRVDLERRIAMRRAELLSGRGSVADEALARLEAKKRATPAGVIVLEALSQTLPDDTYLNELRIEAGKVQIAGLTRDAPSLIRLIEQSQHFTRATFFAPTTRAPTDERERFHIEAHVEPVFPTPQ